MTWLLVGAGGHAKAIVEALEAADEFIDSYVDPTPNDWLDAEHIDSDDRARWLGQGTVVMGLGGVTPEALRRRLALFRWYRGGGWDAPAVIHPDASVSENSMLGDGAIVMATAVVQPDAVVGEAAIVNTGAVVEHDSSIEAGAHIAPRAIILGGASVGAASLIGAGAVVLPGAEVPADFVVPALTRYPK